MKSMASFILRATLCVLLIYYWSSGMLGCLAFEIDQFRSLPKTVSEGDTLKLICVSDAPYDWCCFHQGEKSCRIEWKKLSKQTWKKNIECSDFDQRTSKDFRYAPTRGMCALEINNITSEGMIVIQICFSLSQTTLYILC